MGCCASQASPKLELTGSYAGHHVASAKGASKTLKSPAPRAAAGAAAKLARGYRDDLSRDASVRAARLASSQKNKN